MIENSEHVFSRNSVHQMYIKKTKRQTMGKFSYEYKKRFVILIRKSAYQTIRKKLMASQSHYYMRSIQMLRKHMKNSQPHLQSNKYKLKQNALFSHYISKDCFSNDFLFLILYLVGRRNQELGTISYCQQTFKLNILLGNSFTLIVTFLEIYFV